VPKKVRNRNRKQIKSKSKQLIIFKHMMSYRLDQYNVNMPLDWIIVQLLHKKFREPEIYKILN